MAKGKLAPKGAFEENGLTELEKHILEALPGTTVELTKKLKLPNTFNMREALIKRLIKLQVTGYVKSIGRPEYWNLTSRGEQEIA